MTWVERKDFESLITSKEIEEQINLRIELMKTMVGSLYPSIVQDEINDLRDLKQKKE